MPGDDNQPAWTDPYQNQPEQADPYDPASYRPLSHHRRRRSARRPIAITTLLLVGAGAAPVHNGTIKLSPAANPEANATSGLGAADAVHGSTGTQSEQPPAITKADAEHVVSHCLQVNNEANAAYSDRRLCSSLHLAALGTVLGSWLVGRLRIKEVPLIAKYPPKR